MKLGIMQPYFLPYIGYFALIQYTDVFIFFDTPQYISHGWVNRNRILKQGGGINYMIVPIAKAHRETSIKDIRIKASERWRERIIGQLSIYKKAPYYRQGITLMNKILYSEDNSLARLNINGIKFVCDFLGIHQNFQVFSEMSLLINEVHAPDEWALNIAQALNFDTYVNPPGGKTFFDGTKYRRHGIKLEFLQAKLPPYVQRTGHFEAGLSILDAIMFCTREEIMNMLSDYEILR
ncbi:MAG: WbqC family protein [Schwartzia sp.]|nr:WbqC family protein [Schwartzia sp. (in: firmicutes)]